MTIAASNRSSEHGHTIVEVLVAATIFVLFVVGHYGTSGAFFTLADIQKSRTDSLTAMNITRARIVADTRGVSSVACTGSDTLELRTNGGGPPHIIEYSSNGEQLLRWESAENKTYQVTDGVVAVDCTSLGSEGVDVAITFGPEPDRFALHVSLLDLPSGGP